MGLKYVVYLTADERAELDAIVKKGKNEARVILSGLVLLFSDINPEGRGGKSNAQISKDLNISEKTIESVKKRFTEGGINKALQRRKKPSNPNSVKFDGAFEAKLSALACSPPPTGRQRWTVRLLAEKVKELGIAANGISHMTVQRILKRLKLDLSANKNFLNRSEQNA
jgi:transposase